MRKILFLAIVCSLPLFAYTKTTKENLYIYNIVKLSGNLEKARFNVKLDDGRSVKTFKDSDGRKIKFRTPAALLTYLSSEGWEIYESGSAILGNHYEGKNSHKTESSWIIRKPCTKKELESFLDAGLKRKKSASKGEEVSE